ncbi:MAG: FAD-binding protein, partial [Acidobacteriota bacterium]
PEDESVWVDAGVLWNDLVEHLLPSGWVPPVLTSNLNVTIGGTLAFGGLGVASHRYGSQVDNVLALEVVTGTGDLVYCSPDENSDLFDCVRCGAGQFGLITRAKLSLRRFLPNVRTFYLLYDDLDALMQDQRRVAREGRFDFTEAWCSPCVQGQRRLGETTVSFAEWLFPVQLSVEYDTAAPSYDGILSSLNFYKSVYREDSRFPDFVRRMEPVFQEWRESGAWNRAHPWMEVLLPWERAAEYIQGVLNGLPPALVTGGQVLLWTCATGRSHSPLFIHPEGDLTMGFAIQSSVHHRAVGMAVSLMQKASDLVMQVGGNRYLSGWVPFDNSRWKMHYGKMWPQVVQWKKFFDPEGVLNPGFIAFRED